MQTASSSKKSETSHRAGTMLPFYLHDTLLFVALGIYPVAIPATLVRHYHSVAAFFWWNAIWPLVFLLLMVPCFNLGLRSRSPRAMLIFGMFLLIIFFLIVDPLIHSGPVGTVLASILMGVQISFYWLTRHWLVALQAEYAVVGRQVGTFQSFRILAGVLGPLGCGFFYAHGNVTAPLYAAAAVCVLASIPLFFLNTPPNPERFIIRNRWRTIQRPQLVAVRRVFTVDGIIENLANNTWQLTFLMFIGTQSALGYVTGISAFGAVMLAYIGGTIFDRKHRTALLVTTTISRIVSSACYLLLFFVHPLWLVTCVDTAARYSLTMLRTTVESYVFGSSKSLNPIEVHLAREFWLNVGRSLSATILAVLFSFFSESWLWCILAIGVVLQITYLDLRRCEKWLR